MKNESKNKQTNAHGNPLLQPIPMVLKLQKQKKRNMPVSICYARSAYFCHPQNGSKKKNHLHVDKYMPVVHPDDSTQHCRK
jgi:hypothetical protein